MHSSPWRRSALVVFAVLAACGGSSARKLEMLHAVHNGQMVALVDGDSVLYGLSATSLHVLSKGPGISELKKLDLPAGLPGDADGNGALLLAGNTLYGAHSRSVFAFDVTNRGEPSLLFQDRACAAASLALDKNTLFVALGGEVTAFDVTDPRAWVLRQGTSRLTEPVQTTFVGPSSMALDSARGFIVLARRDSLEVRRTSDFTRVRQASTGTDSFPVEVWSVVGLRQNAVLVCGNQAGLRSIPLGDDGTLGTPASIDPTPCNGMASGESVWLGLPNTQSGQTPFLGVFGKRDLASGASTTYELSRMQVIDEQRVPRVAGRYGVGAFKGVVENADYTYLDVGDIWVLARRQ